MDRAPRRTQVARVTFFAAFVAVSYVLLAPPGAVPAPPPFPFADKAFHVVSFAVLGVLGRFAYPEKPTWGVWVALLLYGVAVEIAQPRVGRSAEALDVVADAVGAAAAWLVPARRLSVR